MKHLDIYKQLPKTNCGQCRPGACMPFAFSVVSGSSQPGDCPHLAPEVTARISDGVERSDWREELIEKLGSEVRERDFETIAAGLGAAVRNGCLVIGCMGREFVITPDGRIEAGGAITPWMKILLLHYVRTAGTGEPSGKWVSYGDLRAGLVKASSFARDCEEPLRRLFDEEREKVVHALGLMRARQEGGLPTPDAWRIGLLPKVEVLVLYWPEDDEFPSKMKVLFDSSADRFLDAESLIFLVEGLVKNIERMIGRAC